MGLIPEWGRSPGGGHGSPGKSHGQETGGLKSMGLQSQTRLSD